MHFSSSSSFLGLLFILLLSLAEAGLNFRLLHQRILQEREEHAQQEADRRLKLLAKDRSYCVNYTVIAGTIQQPLNHFKIWKKLKFSQRYWAFDGYWKKPDGPVFLYIGGACPLSSTSLLAGHHVELAEKYGALLVALEHRFYGESIIPHGLESQNLQFLTIKQVLRDLDSFHRLVTRKYKLTSHNTWICFGEKYGGNLAAWFRLKFPGLVFAAVSSSAPVKAEVDFRGFNQVVGRALLDPDLGGSKECQKAVAEAFCQVDDMLRAGKWVQVEKDFRACDRMWDPFDLSLMVTHLTHIFMAAVQYHNQGISLPSVKFLCDKMTDHKIETAYLRLIAVNQKALQLINETCTESSHWSHIKFLQRTDIHLEDVRQLYFQKCTEFGYFRTCKDNTCPFSRYQVLQEPLDICKQVFNITSDQAIERQVYMTNYHYGGDNPDVSRVLFVNGDIDPWHVLSVLRNQSGITAIFIKGTSNTADMMPSRPDDPLPLVEARKQINSQVGTWLELARKMS